MSAGREWYVAQEGEVVGPLSVSDLAALASTKAPPFFVWTEGFESWVDASEVDSLRAAMGQPAQAAWVGREVVVEVARPKPSLAERARHELIEYAAIAAYLYVCFGALILYKAAILNSEGIAFAPLGFAAAKALILGKFLLLLRASRIGELGSGSGRMILDIAFNALVFALLLIVLAVAEEIIVGWFHGRSAGTVLSEMTGNSMLQVLATAILMVLVLVPYFGFHQITKRLGDGVLLRMLIERA